MTPRCAAALSSHPDPAVAAGETCGQLLEDLAGERPDAVLVFATAGHGPALARIGLTVASVLEPAAVAGASAEGILAAGQAVEGGTGLALFAVAGAGGAAVVDPARLGGGTRLGFEPAGALLLADAATADASGAAERLADLGPGGSPLPVVGGLAGATVPGSPRLLCAGRVQVAGSVAVVLGAEVALQPVVSQGCRPVGSPWTVTRAEGPLVLELGGRPALTRLEELVADPEAAAVVAGGGIHLGVVVDERADRYESGDFLVRSLVGAQRASGAVTTGEVIPVGSVVQFHARDPSTADHDLRRQLAGRDALGAVVFTCDARGGHPTRSPAHDVRAVEEVLGAPHAGLLCAGEVGPVRGRTFVHGQTASVAVVTARP